MVDGDRRVAISSSSPIGLRGSIFVNSRMSPVRMSERSMRAKSGCDSICAVTMRPAWIRGVTSRSSESYWIVRRRGVKRAWNGVSAAPREISAVASVAKPWPDRACRRRLPRESRGCCPGRFAVEAGRRALPVADPGEVAGELLEVAGAREREHRDHEAGAAEAIEPDAQRPGGGGGDSDSYSNRVLRKRSARYARRRLGSACCARASG
jgi:hypothetical protein